MSAFTKPFRFALFVWVGLIAEAPPAKAQQRPTQNFLVGDRALGMAGAFVGLANDASAIFHNPGGVAFLPGGTVNTSLWAAAYETQSLAGGFATANRNTPLSSRELRSLPFFIAGSGRVGLGSRSARRHVIAFGAFSPYVSRYEFSTQPQASSQSIARLDVLHDESAQWFGASYAYLTSRSVGLGLSLFVSHWSIKHQESLLQLQRVVGLSPQEETQVSALRLQRRLVHLVPRLGGVWRATPALQLGLMLQPPGLPLYGEVEAVGVRIVDPASEQGFDVLNVRSTDAPPRSAWELRAGAALTSGVHGILSIDASVLGPEIRTPVPNALQDWTRIDAFPQGTNLRPTLRAAVGYSTLVLGRIPMRGGLMGEHTLRREADDPLMQASHTQSLGAAFSVGHRFADFDLSLGVTGEHSVTGILAPAGLSGQGEFVPRELSRTTLFFYLSGGSKAARLLKNTVTTRLKTGEW